MRTLAAPSRPTVESGITTAVRRHARACSAQPRQPRCHPRRVQRAGSAQLAAPGGAGAAAAIAGALGLDGEAAAQLLARAGLTESDAADVQAALAVLLIGQQRQAVLRVVVARPQLLGQPLPVWWAFLAGYGVPHARFLALAAAQPGLMTHAGLYAAGGLMVRLKRLGMSDADVRASVLVRCPEALAADVAGQVDPLLRYLEASGLTRLQLRDLVTTAPSLLLADVPTVLEPKLQALRDAGFEECDLRKLVGSYPQVWAHSRGSLVAKLRLLEGVGFRGRRLVALLLADPLCLSYARPNLERKALFLSQALRQGPDDVLANCPAYFSCSLLATIGPRVRFVQERRLHARVSVPALSTGGRAVEGGVDAATPPAAGASAPSSGEERVHAGEELHLGLLLAGSDADFCAAAGAPLSEFVAFGEAWRLGEGLRWACTNAPYASRS